MKLFWDTNMLIDLITARSPFGSDAQTLFELGKTHQVELLISDLTIINTAYSLRKYDFKKEEIYDVLLGIFPYFTITTMGRSVIERSLQKRGKDFEDDAQYYSAIDAHADFIITRNKKDFPQEDFILEPKEFFALMNITY